ncbi:hypothetical protein [Nocardioides sp. LHG3406-4]|uniref:phage tail tube protein n=1 Tax=Nocardioides sp. LHG3406-4 TaxID=2804575 RepID=UPI003CF3A361
MSITIPEGTPTLANRKVKAVLSVVDRLAPKLATEYNAATSVDVTAHLFNDGWNPTGAQAKGERKKRLASRKGVESLNATTFTLAALQYSHLPQEDDSAPGNEARELFVEGLKIDLIELQGIDGETGVAAVGDRTIDHWVELGTQIYMGDPADENGEFFIYQELVYVLPSGPIHGVMAT